MRKIQNNIESFSGYLHAIEKKLAQGDATEHTHRSSLETMVESLASGITVTNEPKHIECGTPDFVIRKGVTTIGYIEAKDIEDLETLYTFENLEKPVLYFLEWVDHGLQEHENDRKDYREVQSRLKKWCGEASNRRAFIISRDGIGFAYPKGAWLVDPLPAGVRGNIH